LFQRVGQQTLEYCLNEWVLSQESKGAVISNVADDAWKVDVTLKLLKILVIRLFNAIRAKQRRVGTDLHLKIYRR
jgi:hypothetical protein